MYIENSKYIPAIELGTEPEITLGALTANTPLAVDISSSDLFGTGKSLPKNAIAVDVLINASANALPAAGDQVFVHKGSASDTKAPAVITQVSANAAINGVPVTVAINKDRTKAFYVESTVNVGANLLTVIIKGVHIVDLPSMVD